MLPDKLFLSGRWAPHALGVPLLLMICSFVFCSVASAVNGSAVDSPGLGQGTAIAVPADGLPFVAYTDIAGQPLKTVKCSNAGCANP